MKQGIPNGTLVKVYDSHCPANPTVSFSCNLLELKTFLVPRDTPAIVIQRYSMCDYMVLCESGVVGFAYGKFLNVIVDE